MRRGETPAVLLHLIGAEQLRTQRLLVARFGGSATSRRREELDRLTDDGVVVDLQLRGRKEKGREQYARACDRFYGEVFCRTVGAAPTKDHRGRARGAGAVDLHDVR